MKVVTADVRAFDCYAQKRVVAHDDTSNCRVDGKLRRLSKRPTHWAVH